MAYEEVTISKGIPMPVKKKRNRYNWEAMEVGDSFFMDKSRQISSTTKWQRAKKDGREYDMAPEGSGFRIWRVS